MTPAAPFVLFAILAGEPVLVDRIAAVVNDDVITLSEVEASAKPYLEQNPGEEKRKRLNKDILDDLISERLLSQQIKEAKISVTDDELERAIQDILRQNKIGPEELEQAIRSRGMSMGQYREDLKSQLIRLKLIDTKVRSRVVIPESELRAEYERRISEDKTEELLHIRHVFFRWGESPDPNEKDRVLEAARAARARLIAGEDFAKVAKEVSQGPTAEQGGDLGELGVRSLLPELARAVEKTQAGEITQPIETSNGVHVVELVSRRRQAPVEFAALRDKIYQELYQKEVERQMKIWLDELRSQSAIDVRL